MNKKHLSIALTLYLFSPTDNEAVNISLESSFSLADLGSLSSEHFIPSHSASKRSSNFIGASSPKKLKDKSQNKSQNSIAQSILSLKQPLHLSQIDTVLSEIIMPEYTNNGTQTDQPPENAEIGVQASQKITTTGTQSNTEMTNKENQVNMAPPAQTESKIILTDSNRDSTRSTGSANNSPTNSNHGQMVQNILKSENSDLKDNNSNGKTDNNQIEKSADNPTPLLSPKENQKTEDRFTNTGTSASNTSVLSTNNPASHTPVTTHHYYHSTTHNNTLSPVTPQEKPAPVTEKAPETLFEKDSFISNFLTSISKNLPKMLSTFINEMIEIKEKNTIRTLRKDEEKTIKNTLSNKKSPSVYTVLDSIKKQCAYLYDSLIELAQRTGSRKRVFNIEKAPSKYPNARMHYRTLGEDSENRTRSKSRRLFRLSGQRARKAIAQTLSSVRRVAIHANKITYNMGQNKRFSRPLNKAEQFVDFSFKRSRIRNNAFVG